MVCGRLPAELLVALVIFRISYKSMEQQQNGAVSGMEQSGARLNRQQQIQLSGNAVFCLSRMDGVYPV